MIPIKYIYPPAPSRDISNSLSKPLLNAAQTAPVLAEEQLPLLPKPLIKVPVSKVIFSIRQFIVVFEGDSKPPRYIAPAAESTCNVSTWSSLVLGSLLYRPLTPN